MAGGDIKSLLGLRDWLTWCYSLLYYFNCEQLPELSEIAIINLMKCKVVNLQIRVVTPRLAHNNYHRVGYCSHNSHNWTCLTHLYTPLQVHSTSKKLLYQLDHLVQLTNQTPNESPQKKHVSNN